MYIIEEISAKEDLYLLTLTSSCKHRYNKIYIYTDNITTLTHTQN